MTLMIVTYVVYLVLSVGLTVWVGQTLHRRGRVFLVDALANETLADSVNHLLLVGFFLINIGFVAVALRYGGSVVDTQGAIEYLSMKEGIVLLILGVMHFFNLLVLSQWRSRAVRQRTIPEVQLYRDDERARTADLGGLHTLAVPVGDERSAPRRNW